ncbi:uncharacterized protein LOC131630510 [Vicia villosa]|uniref:uncharacterized protein LOC131630510 n=1 Tax=Vicia villosa TaxID=3911 RepID=UPI00273CDE75|nr:uncharacterized protein LOC131630510 [Vicia villosa]
MRPPTGGRGSWSDPALCLRAGSSPTSPASTASTSILRTLTPCPGPPDTPSRGGTMRWDHTACTWTARCTTTSPGGRSPTMLRLSPSTGLLYIQAGWHAGPASWSGISRSGACGSLGSCRSYPGHPSRLLLTQ